jgi:hypothetical protein
MFCVSQFSALDLNKPVRAFDFAFLFAELAREEND